MVSVGTISTLLQPALVHLNVVAARRTDAIREVAGLLQGHPQVPQFQGFYNDLLARERLDTTCLGNGVALPHARTEHVKSVVMAVGRIPEGVFFENGNQSVNLLFVIGTPRTAAASYLAVVSALCRLLREPAVRQRLLSAETVEAFLDVIAGAESA